MVKSCFYCIINFLIKAINKRLTNSLPLSPHLWEFYKLSLYSYTVQSTPE